MRVSPKFVAAAACAAIASVAVSARQQAVFRSETNYIEIVASVTDKDGEFVRGLTAADFEVREQGKRESIETVSFVELPDRPGAGASTPAAYRADVPAALREDGRLFLIYLSGASGSSSPKIRQLALDFVQHHLRPGDHAAVWDTQFPLRDVTFSTDTAALMSQIDAYRGNGPSADLPFAYRCGPGAVFSPGEAGLREQCQAALAEPHRQLTTAITWFNAIQGRRKSIVLFAGGWDGASDPVSRADITLYAVDVRGLIATPPNVVFAPQGSNIGDALVADLRATSASVEGLHNLATRTGGFALVNHNEFASGFERIIEANSRYYVLGYTSSFTRRDRVFRDLEVKVTRPGVKVHARRGYFPR